MKDKFGRNNTVVKKPPLRRLNKSSRIYMFRIINGAEEP